MCGGLCITVGVESRCIPCARLRSVNFLFDALSVSKARWEQRVAIEALICYTEATIVYVVEDASQQLPFGVKWHCCRFHHGAGHLLGYRMMAARGHNAPKTQLPHAAYQNKDQQQKLLEGDAERHHWDSARGSAERVASRRALRMRRPSHRASALCNLDFQNPVNTPTFWVHTEQQVGGERLSHTD